MTKNLPLAAMLLTGCGTGQAWTVHLTPEGVEVLEGSHSPTYDYGENTLYPNALQHFEGYALMTSPRLLLDGQAPEHAFSHDGDWENSLHSVQVGQGTTYALRNSIRGYKNPERLQVVRYEEGVWVQVADLDQASGRLYSRHGHAPVLYNPDDGLVRTLEGEYFGERTGSRPYEVLVAGDVLFETMGWVDTREVATAGERRQERIIGPECEALLAGEMAAVIATPAGLETLSIVSNFLHHERVLPDCSVETIEEIYHPQSGFDPLDSVQAGEQAWAYWGRNGG